jgi:hypothetical protein
MDTAGIRVVGEFSRVDGNQSTTALTGVDASASSQDLVVRNSFADVTEAIATGTLTRAAVVLRGLSEVFTTSEPWANLEL